MVKKEDSSKKEIEHPMEDNTNETMKELLEEANKMLRTISLRQGHQKVNEM